MASSAAAIQHLLTKVHGSKTANSSKPPCSPRDARPPGVFGADEIDIIVSGRSDGDLSASFTGFARQAPGLKLEVTLIRMGDDTAAIDLTR